MPLLSPQRHDDVVFVKTVRHLVVSRNLLCESPGGRGRAPLTDHAFRTILDQHLRVAEVLCTCCEVARGDPQWIDKAIRHIGPLREWLANEWRSRDGPLMRKVRALAHREDAVLLPMAPLLMGFDAWPALAVVVDRLGPAIQEEESARMTGMRRRGV
jgi:hypothetical protein